MATTLKQALSQILADRSENENFVRPKGSLVYSIAGTIGAKNTRTILIEGEASQVRIAVRDIRRCPGLATWIGEELVSMSSPSAMVSRYEADHEIAPNRGYALAREKLPPVQRGCKKTKFNYLPYGSDIDEEAASRLADRQERKRFV